MGQRWKMPPKGRWTVYRWMRCGCRIEEDKAGTFYHQRAIGCRKPHSFTRKMIEAWARRYDGDYTRRRAS